MTEEVKTQEVRPASSFERIERLERTVDQLRMAAVNSEQMIQQAIQTVMSLEQSYASLAKTVSAVVGELEATDKLDGAAVMKRIRVSDEQADRQQVQVMLSEKTIQPTDSVAASSLVVVKQAMLEMSSQNTRTQELTNYRILELPSIFVPEDTRKLLLDKKVGDTVEVKRESRADGVEVILTATVIEIYELTERERRSDT